LYPFGRDAAPFVAEVKARKNGSGFAQLEKWLGEYQVLFLRRDRADPFSSATWRSTASTALRERSMTGTGLHSTVRWPRGWRRLIPTPCS
jgi:hypothetical protein